MPSPYGYGNSSIKKKWLLFGISQKKKESKTEEVEPETEAVEAIANDETSPEPEPTEKAVDEASDSDEEPSKRGKRSIFVCCW